MKDSEGAWACTCNWGGQRRDCNYHVHTLMACLLSMWLSSQLWEFEFVKMNQMLEDQCHVVFSIPIYYTQASMHVKVSSMHMNTIYMDTVTYTYTCTHADTDTHTHTHTRKHTHTHTHTHIPLSTTTNHRSIRTSNSPREQPHPHSSQLHHLWHPTAPLLPVATERSALSWQRQSESDYRT